MNMVKFYMASGDRTGRSETDDLPGGGTDP